MKNIILAGLCLIIVAAAPLLWQARGNALSMPANTTTVASSAHHLSAAELSAKFRSSWAYDLSRASGMVAAVLLILIIISGIGQVTGFTYRLVEPLMAWSLHKALSLSLGAAIAVHGLSLLFDKYTPYTVIQLLIPFTVHYKPLIVAYGIFATYIAAILIVTSLYWINTKQGLWRLLHYLGYVLVILVFLHGLYLGTDIAHGFLRVLWWMGAVIIGAGMLSRLRRMHTINVRENHHP